MKAKKTMSLLLTAAVTMSAVSLTMSSPVMADGLDSVAVTYVTSPLNVPSIVEKDHSIFAENMKDLGIEEVTYSDLTSGADQTQALASGDIQFLYAVGATSVILSAANGADIKIISMYSRSPKAFCLFSNDESITSPADLKGKTIAGPQGTILHELLVAYLASGDLTIEDVNFVNTTIPDAMAALSGGSADCALLAGAAAYNTSQSGAHLVTNGENLVEATIACATTNEFYEEHKDVVDKFLEAQKEVLDFMEENPEEAMEEAAENLDLEVDAVKEMYEYYDFDMTIKDSDIDAMKSTMEFMLDTEMIENEVDIDDLVIR